jgi:hypothetical protein
MHYGRKGTALVIIVVEEEEEEEKKTRCRHVLHH